MAPNVERFSEIALSCHGFVGLVYRAFGPLSPWGYIWVFEQINFLDSMQHNAQA